jgi:hypothetical protein
VHEFLMMHDATQFLLFISVPIIYPDSASKITLLTKGGDKNRTNP